MTGLRSPRAPIIVGAASSATLHLRAQVLEAWDAVRVDANPEATIKELKLRALEQLYPHGHSADEFVVKLHGFEVLDEDVSLARAGAVNGSIFLIADRRRRPVQ